jgi:hypothetical protein
MVGREEGGRDNGKDLPGLRGVSEGAALSEAGAGVPVGGGKTLAQRTWSAVDCADRGLACQTSIAAKFYDEERGCKVFVVRSTYASFGEVFSCWMVHRV